MTAPAAQPFMTDRIKPSGGSVLQRWSRLKSEERDKEKREPASRIQGTRSMPTDADSGARAMTSPPAQPAASPARESALAEGTDALPPVESLTLDSDFAPFLKPKVDEVLKRRALKQLFRDPHFNVMDGLDVYIDDYSKPDPIPPEVVREMVQGRYIFNPPPTRINAHGYVEDVPPDELAALERDGDATTPEAPGDAVATSQLPPPDPDMSVPSQLPLLETDEPGTSELKPDAVHSSTPGTNADSPSATPADSAEKDPGAR